MTMADAGTAYTNASHLCGTSGPMMPIKTNTTTATSQHSPTERSETTMRRLSRVFLGMTGVSLCSRTRSSTETLNRSESCNKMRTSGMPFPCSHLETDLSE